MHGKVLARRETVRTTLGVLIALELLVAGFQASGKIGVNEDIECPNV